MEMRPIRAAVELDAVHPCQNCAVRLLAICGVLGSDELRKFKASSATVARAAGETIFFEGDPATHVYNLTSGVLRLSKLLPDGRRQIAGFLFPGDFLGITMEDEHAFTAEAITPSQLCQFPRARFDGFVDTHPHLERRLYAIAAHELAAARQQVVLLGRKTAAERVASFLLMLDARRMSSGVEASPNAVPVSITVTTRLRNAARPRTTRSARGTGMIVPISTTESTFAASMATPRPAMCATRNRSVTMPSAPRSPRSVPAGRSGRCCRHHRRRRSGNAAA